MDSRAHQQQPANAGPLEDDLSIHAQPHTRSSATANTATATQSQSQSQVQSPSPSPSPSPYHHYHQDQDQHQDLEYYPFQFETDTVSASSDIPRPLASTTSQQQPHGQPQHQNGQARHHHSPSHTSDVVSPPHPVTSNAPSTASTPRSSLNHIIKRKPLSATASPFAARFSQGSASGAPPSIIDLPRPEHRFSRSGSVDSPTYYHYDFEYPAASPQDFPLPPSSR